MQALGMLTQYFYSSVTPPIPEICRGPFQRVDNIAKLIFLVNHFPETQKWVFSSTDGPFCALGEREIKAIVEKNSVDKKINCWLNGNLSKVRKSDC
jgi:hypothetical protein